MGYTTHVRMHVDASATKGMVMKRGVGKAKHIEAQHLWVQEKQRRGALDVTKIERNRNVADLLTHHCVSRDLRHHLHGFGTAAVVSPCVREDGRLDNTLPTRGGV